MSGVAWSPPPRRDEPICGETRHRRVGPEGATTTTVNDHPCHARKEIWSLGDNKTQIETKKLKIPAGRRSSEIFAQNAQGKGGGEQNDMARAGLAV